MSKLWESHLAACIASGDCVEVYRDRLTGRDAIVGRILRFSSAVLLIERIADETYEPDGFSAIVPDDVTRIVSGHRELEFATRVAPRQSPQDFDGALLQLASAMTVFERLFGTVSIYIEGISSEVCFIGNEVQADHQHVMLRTFGTHRNLDRSTLLLTVNDVSRVDGGRAYERRLVEHFKATRP